MLFSGASGTLRHALQGNGGPILAGVMFVGSFGGVQPGVGGLRGLKAVVAVAMVVMLRDLGKQVWS